MKEAYPFMFIIKEKSEDFYCRNCRRVADITADHKLIYCTRCNIMAEFQGDPRD